MGNRGQQPSPTTKYIMTLGAQNQTSPWSSGQLSLLGYEHKSEMNGL